MYRNLRRLAAGLLMPLFLASAPALASPAAEVEPGASATAKLRVRLVAASRGEPSVDPRIASIQKLLADFAFTSYKLLDEKTVTLGASGSQSVALPRGHTLQISPRRFEKSGRIGFRVQIVDDKSARLVDVEYAIEPGRDIVFGGIKLDDGRLIVAIHHGS